MYFWVPQDTYYLKPLLSRPEDIADLSNTQKPKVNNEHNKKKNKERNPSITLKKVVTHKERQQERI